MTSITTNFDGSPIRKRVRRGHVVFGGCDYLGLSRHPRVIGAAVRAAGRFGLSTSASRTTTGDTAEHRALEHELAVFLESSSAMLTLDGLTANMAAMQALAGRVTAAVLDERAHPTLALAATAAALPVLTYRHRDADDARRVANAAGGPVVIATDGVFAADGTIAPVEGLRAALPCERSAVVIDDCHGFMVLGDGGRGTSQAAGHSPSNQLLVTTTLAKGLGCSGGVVAGPQELLSRARDRISVYVCTTPASPALIAAAREAMRVASDEPARRVRLFANAALFADALEHAGLGPASPATPIFAFWTANRDGMEELRQRVDARGFELPLMEYPSGPAPCYFRASVSADHTVSQLESFAEILSACRGTA